MKIKFGQARGGKAGSPFKEGSFVGFLLWVSGSSHFFSFSFSFLSFFLGVLPCTKTGRS